MSSQQSGGYIKPYHVKADTIQPGTSWKYTYSWILGLVVILMSSLNFNENWKSTNPVLSKVNCNNKINLPGLDHENLSEEFKQKFDQNMYCTVCMKTPLISKKLGVAQTSSTMNNYVDTQISLRIDYTDDDIYFRDDKIEILYSELGSMCTMDSFCNNIADLSTLKDYPSLVRYEKSESDGEYGNDFEHFLNGKHDPRDYLTKFKNDIFVEPSIVKHNRDSKYFLTEPFISRRFGRITKYSLLFKIKSKEATKYIKNVSLVMTKPNSKYRVIEILTKFVLFFVTLVLLICSSVELANKPYKEWVSLNRSLLRIVVIQLLSCGALGYSFELMGSNFTSAIQLGESILRSIQVSLNFSIYITGFFYMKRNRGTVSTLKTVGVSVLGVCYVGQKVLEVVSQNLPEYSFLSDVASIFNHYLFLIISFYYMIILILALTFWFSGEVNQEITNDNFTSILIGTSFFSLTTFLMGVIFEELSITQNSVFCLFATQVNQSFLNIFLLYMSVPLSFDEETRLNELEENDRKEFGMELQDTSKIDHLDTFEDTIIRNTYSKEYQNNEDDFEVDIDFDNSIDEDEPYEKDSYTDEENDYEDNMPNSDSQDSYEGDEY